MNDFEKRIAPLTGDGLYSLTIDNLQVNLGLKCNQVCNHCHLEASPNRKEIMEWPTMEMVIEAARILPCRLLDLTGGAPELNPHFRRFVTALRREGHTVQVRTNLTVLLEPGMETMAELFRELRIGVVASMSCYLEENVRAQRGEGAYHKSITVLRKLNDLGYGLESDLPLNLVYNPGGPFLPPPQAVLEQDYRRELHARFGISFTNLLTIANMPLGRFRSDLERQNLRHAYLELLRQSFNPQTLEGLMCRHQLSVRWDGTLYDCDFNLALNLPVNHGSPNHIRSFSPEAFTRRRIATGEHCFACTAGQGSSCGGALA